jgi:predicted DNA-binding protein (MmcQ/YjbR family)
VTAPAAKRPASEKAAADALARLREICLALPETTEKLAWGEPTFRVRERLFVMYTNNHHGDGRLAIWCNAPAGAQHELVAADPKHFFVPPYVGKSGWIGINLNTGLSWPAIASLIAEAHRVTAAKGKGRKR